MLSFSLHVKEESIMKFEWTTTVKSVCELPSFDEAHQQYLASWEKPDATSTGAAQAVLDTNSMLVFSKQMVDYLFCAGGKQDLALLLDTWLLDDGKGTEVLLQKIADKSSAECGEFFAGIPDDEVWDKFEFFNVFWLPAAESVQVAREVRVRAEDSR